MLPPLNAYLLLMKTCAWYGGIAHPCLDMGVHVLHVQAHRELWVKASLSIAVAIAVLS